MYAFFFFLKPSFQYPQMLKMFFVFLPFNLHSPVSLFYTVKRFYKFILLLLFIITFIYYIHSVIHSLSFRKKGFSRMKEIYLEKIQREPNSC